MNLPLTSTKLNNNSITLKNSGKVTEKNNQGFMDVLATKSKNTILSKKNNNLKTKESSKKTDPSEFGNADFAKKELNDKTQKEFKFEDKMEKVNNAPIVNTAEEGENISPDLLKNINSFNSDVGEGKLDLGKILQENADGKLDVTELVKQNEEESSKISESDLQGLLAKLDGMIKSDNNSKSQNIPIIPKQNIESNDLKAQSLKLPEFNTQIPTLEKSEQKSMSDDKNSNEGMSRFSDAVLNSTYGIELPQKNSEVSFSEIFENVSAKELMSTRAENMQNIVQNARARFFEGGGEINIHMKPDGLGQVNLKIGSLNGKISVSMKAENDEAKKLLEDSAKEIREALEAVSLAVEDVKVEGPQDSQKDYSNNQQNEYERQQKEFARDFMNQFRDERQALRDDLGLSNPLRKANDIETRLDKDPSEAQVKSKDLNRRLNLVA